MNSHTTAGLPGYLRGHFKSCLVGGHVPLQQPKRKFCIKTNNWEHKQKYDKIEVLIIAHT